jgi:hypothetical protein
MAHFTRIAVAAALVLLAIATASPARAQASIGVGFHSWRTIDDLRSDGFGNLRRSGVSYLASYQAHLIPLLRVEVDGEIFPKGFGGSTNTAVSPQVFILLGGFVYGGVGVGTIYSSSFNHDFSNPFYIGRVGLNIPLVPRLHLDVNANYEVGAFNQLHNVSTGTATVGALVRFTL